MNSKLYLLCGPIASGKGSYCLNAAKKGFIICNDDQIVNLCHSGNYLLYSTQNKILYKFLENSLISASLMLGLNIILDDAKNVNPLRRSRYVSWAHSFDRKVEAIVFKNEGPEVHAKRRFENDSRGYDYNYWLNIVAMAHQATYSEPTLEEGFDKIHHISYQEIVEGKVIE